MGMRRLVTIYLLLDALVVVVIGITSIHGDHGLDFFLVNLTRLAIMGLIVMLWRAGSNKWIERILFGKHPSGE
jgi:hypothetical protein